VWHGLHRVSGASNTRLKTIRNLSFGFPLTLPCSFRVWSRNNYHHLDNTWAINHLPYCLFNVERKSVPKATCSSYCYETPLICSVLCVYVCVCVCVCVFVWERESERKWVSEWVSERVSENLSLIFRNYNKALFAVFRMHSVIVTHSSHNHPPLILLSTIFLVIRTIYWNF